MRPPRLNNASSRIRGWGCLTAILLGIAGLCDPNFAVAADARAGGTPQRFDVDPADRTVPPAARRGIVARRSEMPPGSVVVLRGRYTADWGNMGGFDFSGLSPPAGGVILGQ